MNQFSIAIGCIIAVLIYFLNNKSKIPPKNIHTKEPESKLYYYPDEINLIDYNKKIINFPIAVFGNQAKSFMKLNDDDPVPEKR